MQTTDDIKWLQINVQKLEIEQRNLLAEEDKKKIEQEQLMRRKSIAMGTHFDQNDQSNNEGMKDESALGEDSHLGGVG